MNENNNQNKNNGRETQDDWDNQECTSPEIYIKQLEDWEKAYSNQTA